MANMSQISKTWFIPKQKNDKAITIKCTKKQFIELDFAATKLQMTKSDLVRAAITEFLLKHL